MKGGLQIAWKDWKSHAQKTSRWRGTPSVSHALISSAEFASVSLMKRNGMIALAFTLSALELVAPRTAFAQAAAPKAQPASRDAAQTATQATNQTATQATTQATTRATTQATPQPTTQPTTPTPQNPVPACTPQIATLCPAATEPRQVVQCLRQHADELSTDCKLDIERFATAGRQAAARAGGQLGGFGGFTSLTPPLPIFSYEGRISKDLTENRVAVSSPVAGSATSITSATLSGGTLHFRDRVTLSSGQTLSQDLYRAEIGVQTSFRLEGKKSFGLRLTAGSTGDQVFQSINDATFSGALTYGFPGSSPGDYWVALIYFANNSPLGDYIPIPGVIYIHKTEHFTGVFGFPVLSLNYTPNTQSSYSLSLFGTTLTTEAAFGSVTSSQGFLQASFNQQRFILHDRQEDRDRLSFEEKKVGVGYRTSLFNAGFGEIQIGRAFDRKLYIGQKILRAEKGLADQETQAFLTANFKYVF